MILEAAACAALERRAGAGLPFTAGSHPLSHGPAMRAKAQASVAVVIVAALCGPAAAQPAPPFCLSNPDIRDAVQSRKAVPPFRAVAEAMREGGDLVAIRLCRAADALLVYDVAVLRLDGRLVHVIVDAAAGRAMPGRRWP